MADRTVKVSLILAAQGFMSGFDQVQQKVARTGTELEKLNQKRQAFTDLGAAALGFGATAAVGVGMAISRFAEFDQQMSFVQAATHETAANMNLLRDAALDAGARTVYSATEAAGAIEELAKAGVSTKDILSGGLDAALDLAAAGGLAVADAAGIAATALKTFNLEGKDMSHVADLLAAGAGKAMGDVSELSQALAQGGQVAKATGLSIEETTAGLAAFASQGLRGSDAGTSFKSMLQRLTPQSAEAQREMDRLGISAYDASGQFIGLANFAGNLQGALHSLTPEQRNSALATIFGADAVRAANVLYEEGADGIRKWTDEVNDQGYAAETAAMRLDNLKGDIEQLGGAFDTALIQSGSGANDALRSLVQTATGAVGMFADLPEPVQQTALYLGIAASAVGLVGGAALIATPRIAEFRAIVSAAGLSMKGLSLAAGGVTLGLTAVIAVVAAVATAQAEARAKAKAYADTLEEGTHRVTKATRDMVAENLVAEQSWLWVSRGSAADAAEELGLNLETVTDAAMGQKEALQELSEVIRAGSGDQDAAQRVADKLGISLLDVSSASSLVAQSVLGEADSIEQAMHMSEQKEKTDRASADGSKTAAEAYLEAADGADELESQLRELIDTINEANGLNQDAVSSNASYLGALEGITAEVQRQKDAYEEANGTLDGFVLSLDQNTASGSANADMLADVASKAQDAALAQFEVDKKTMSAKDAADKYAGTLAAQRQAFEESATAAGFNADEVQALADKVFALPSEKQIAILAETGPAYTRVDEFIRTYDGKVITLQLTTNQVVVGDRVYGGLRNNAIGNYYEKGKVKEFRAGGFASGIYPATPGGIHRFAEAGHDEAYITMDPAHRDRSRAIWGEVGQRLGAWQAAPAPVIVMPQSGGGAQINLKQEIHPTPGMSEAQVGRISAESIQFALRGK